MKIEHNGQWAMTIHSVTLVLSKIKVLLQTLLGTRPTTLYSEGTVAHTCQYDIILYYSTYVVLSNLTSHINGMT